MNSPPQGARGTPCAARLFADGVTQSLEELARSRDEATPEPIFRSEHVEQSYQWLCEQLRAHFKPGQAELLRLRIADLDYWEYEARCYRIAAEEQIWANALKTQGIGAQDSRPKAEQWQSVASTYRAMLQKNGLSSQQVAELRLSIDRQSYWQTEANYYEPLSKLREQELKEQWAAEARRVKRPARRLQPSQRQHPTTEQGQPDRVSERTRSKTGKSTGAGVVKHQHQPRRKGGRAKQI